MMVIRERVFRVVEQSGRPMSAQAIARKMRMKPPRIAGDLNKLHAYGYLTVVRVTRVKEKAVPTMRRRRFYAPSGKPYEVRT